MSEIKDRLKELRKHLGMTQQKFAEKVSIKQNTYSQYEIGRSKPTDAVIDLICREFGVSEEWLRNGTGEMLRQETEEGQYIKALLDDALAEQDEKFRVALLEVILRLDTQQLRTVKEYAEKYLLPTFGRDADPDEQDQTGTGRSEQGQAETNTDKHRQTQTSTAGEGAFVRSGPFAEAADLAADPDVPLPAGSGTDPEPYALSVRDEIEIARKVEDYRQQLRAEKRAEAKSSVLSDGEERKEA